MRFEATTVKLERIWKHSNVELVRCGLLDFRVYLNDTLVFVYVPLRHAEGRSFIPGQVFPRPAPVKRPLPITCPLVKAHTKLPIQVLAAYPYLACSRLQK